VSLLKRAAQCGAKVALCSLSPQVREIFEMTRLHRLFDIFESKEDAVASVED
jgi:anti-sigma B factor antagonist